jgi:penicillin G amidase
MAKYAVPIRLALVILIALLATFVVVVVWMVRSPLPKTDGTLHVSGSGAEIVIRRDARGIPHIGAATAQDAIFGEGFACAQDRLWQMDVLRREAEGRLSEILGPSTISVDTYFRTIGLGELAAQAAEHAPPREQAMLRAYAAGVNAEIAGGRLPLEFRLLGYQPAPWTPADSFAVGLLVTRGQDDNWATILMHGDLARKVGAKAADALIDEQIPSLEEYMPGYGPSNPENGAQAGNAVIAVDWSAAAGVDAPAASEHQGSNNWAVAASRTNTGKPVLSNDTHLDHSLPSTWWIAQVEGGSLDVEGFTLPGVPGVIIGHNRNVAFGVTSAAEDVQDLFVEKFAAAKSDRYLADGRWAAAAHRREVIAVKNAGSVTLDVLVTRHGPVVKRAGLQGLALDWTLFQDRINLSSIIDYDDAANWQQFRSALSEFVAPTLNFAYADAAGHVGYQDAGRVPLRRNGDGTVPVEGQDDRFAWVGEVPFDRLPHALDPPSAFVATANNQIVTASFAPVLSRDYLSPYRIHEIVSRLDQLRAASPLVIGSIQSDSFDYPRSVLARAVEPILAASANAADRQLAQTLRGWDGRASVDATAPTFMAALDTALQGDMLRKKLGATLLTRYAKEHHFLTPVVRTLQGDRTLAPIGVTKASILAELLPAAHDAERQLGFPQRALQQWGDANAAVYDHPLAIAWPLTLLNAPTIPQPGDPYTVFQSRSDFGPSMRLVADASDWDNSSMLLTLGESGVWTDPHYDDEERDWVDVGWSATPFSDAAVGAAAVATLRLEPDHD